MEFPSARLASREFTPGDWPQKTYQSVSGAEVRILRGSKRTGATLELRYENIPDTSAELFVQHYNQSLGTFHSFKLPTIAPARTAGWGGANNWQSASPEGNSWRYASPPSVTASPAPGYSSVRVSLVSVV